MVGTDDGNRAEQPLIQVDQSDRFLNLAVINIGEATTLIGNFRQRGLSASADNYALVILKLMAAASAVSGEVYHPPTADQHKELGKPGN